MIANKSVIQIIVAIFFIVGSSAYISMQCWPAQIGCHQPSVVGWSNYLNLVFTVSLGPFAPLYLLAVFAPSVSYNIWSIVCYIIVLLISFAPWYIYYRRKGYLSIAFASILWVFFGFLFGIAAFI